MGGEEPVAVEKGKGVRRDSSRRDESGGDERRLESNPSRRYIRGKSLLEVLVLLIERREDQERGRLG